MLLLTTMRTKAIKILALDRLHVNVGIMVGDAAVESTTSKSSTCDSPM
jgi:hypothetical protein